MHVRKNEDYYVEYLKPIHKSLLRNKSHIFKSVSDLLLLPHLLQLRSNLFAAIFRIMKLLPAKHILSSAYARGEIKKNSIIVDTSSGTFALGMGLICSEMGLPFQIFGDPAIEPGLVQQLKHLGGNVHISTNPNSPGAYQKLRLEALSQFISQNANTFWMQQYDNIDGVLAYAPAGELILQSLGSKINLVGTVGSGGSTCGMIKTIRQVNPFAELIGVDTFNSVLFGQTDGARFIRGLGNSIMPKNLDHTCFDEVHWISANDAFYYNRWLYTHKGIFCGPTGGAAYQVASYLADKNKNKTYIFIVADEGHRYLSTVYNDQWLKSQLFYNEKITPSPVLVETPNQVLAPWSYIHWQRKSYRGMIGIEFNDHQK